ncbi:hypothetical protein Nwat_0575 [Nitrosococcus watsonii C-113]|uniref:Uncharacterized protein n=1 Tax=Nitrosococcus watsoni (strain C-113) TaxID=105559 RepID=D8KB04_NITWC|nr:hypothetical protein Nwat_0575 [Nitrosococcus watsonii C-113]
MGVEANPWIKFCYEDYKSLPELEIRHYELLNRELAMVPSPSEYHQCSPTIWGFCCGNMCKSMI